MILLSRGGFYALKILGYLALCDGIVATAVLCRELDLPAAYASKILQKLARKKIVSPGARGPGGGFRLARPPETISILEVLEAVTPEDIEIIDICPMKLNPCLPGRRCPWHENVTLWRRTTIHDLAVRAVSGPPGGR